MIGVLLFVMADAVVVACLFLLLLLLNGQQIIFYADIIGNYVVDQ